MQCRQLSDSFCQTLKTEKQKVKCNNCVVCRKHPRVVAWTHTPTCARTWPWLWPESPPSSSCGRPLHTSSMSQLRGTTLCNTVQHNKVQYNTIQYNTIQYNTIQYTLYNTTQYNAVAVRCAAVPDCDYTCSLPRSMIHTQTSR